MRSIQVVPLKLAPRSCRTLGIFGMRRRAFEQHVFQQVRHPGFAIAFVPRADEDRHVDRDDFLAVVGKQQNSNAVVELVFRDAFDFVTFISLPGGGSPAFTSVLVDVSEDALSWK